MDRRNPTFEDIRRVTQNGRYRTRVLMYGSSVECRAKTTRKGSQIDFDLFSCNYDVKPKTLDILWSDYSTYLGRTNFRSKLHSHFGRTSIWFDVRPEDAEEWFKKILRTLQNSASVTLCEAAREFAKSFQADADELLLSALIESNQKSDQGAIIQFLAPAWLDIVQLIQVNPSILNSMDPRKFEELIAGAYKRAGFDKVILTPRSWDFGVDVIAEKHGLGRVRIVDQIKRFAPGSIVTAHDVRALGFVALADGKQTKGVVTTTATFAPKISQDRILSPYLASGRIELVDGVKLLDRLVRLMHGYKN